MTDPDAKTQVEPVIGPVASAQPAVPADPATVAPAPGQPEPPPRLADGIELVGLFEDSGFKEPPYIARRSDGQVIQLPELLYRLVEQVDGRSGYDELARRMTEATERGVDGDAVRFLVDEQLRPLGVLASADGSSPKLQKLDPLLALRFKAGVVPERLTFFLTTIFKPLFWPPIIIAVVAGLLALDVWLLASHGIAAAAREVLYAPALLLMLLGAVVLSTAFHETGHASACRYGGATPGKMGAGIYIIWPVFYTDVTDAYRLGRWGRLRTDLGGIYFNAIFALATVAVYFATGFEPLLLIVLLQNVAMIQQLLPFLRLDGYYVIGDLTGVPDMFSRIRPTLASLIPGRPMDERVAELKPWVRRVVAGYVAVLIPLLLFMLVMMAIQAPRVFATAYDSVGVKYDAARDAFGQSNVLTGLGGVLQIGGLLLPAVGIALTGGRIGTRVGRGAWTWSAGEPLRRAGLVGGTLAAAALTAFLWWPNGEYRPIQPGERGTLAGALRTIRDIPTGRPALTEERRRQLGGAPSEREQRGSAERESPAQDDDDPSRPQGEQSPSQDPRPEATATPGSGTAPPAQPGEPTPEPTTEPAAPAPAVPTATPTPTPTPTPSATPTPTLTPTPTPQP